MARAFVVRRAAVAERDIEVVVGPERELTAVVVRLRLLDDEQVPAGRLVGDPPVHRELVDVRVARVVGVVHVEVVPVGREREPEEALLAVRLGVALEVEHRACDELPVADRAHPAGLLGDVERGITAAHRHGRGATERRDPCEPHGAGRRRLRVRDTSRRSNRCGRGARECDHDRDDSADPADTSRHGARRLSTAVVGAASPTIHIVKYLVLVPDGCADEPLEELDHRTPLEAAHMPRAGRARRRG